MRKRTKLLTAILVLAGVLVLSFGGAALAHGSADTDETMEGCWGQSGWGHGAIWSEEVSDLLGLTPEEILAQRQEGNSLVEIAATQGINEDALVEAILAGRADAMQQGIDAGYFTDEQVDEMLEWMEQNVRQSVNRTDFGPPENGATGGYGWMEQHMGTGAMGQWGEAGMGYGHGGMHRSGGMLGWGMGFS